MQARSIGAPNAGRLEGGVELKPTAAMRFLSAYENTHAHYALPQLVALLDRASKHVQRRYPGSVMGLGHLSNARGGDIDRHASHESGRDADVSFYARDARGKPFLLPTLTHFDRQGRAQGHPGVVFDDARNWELIVALVGDPEVRVANLFVAPFVRARLLAYGVKIGTSKETLTKVRMVMVHPKGAALHDDHVHVRIGCPDGMNGCIEYARARNPRGNAPAPRVAQKNEPHTRRAKDAKTPKSTAKSAPKASPKSSPKSTAKPPKQPITSTQEEDDEPEGLDRLIGPSVRGWDSIHVPTTPLYTPEED